MGTDINRGGAAAVFEGKGRSRRSTKSSTCESNASSLQRSPMAVHSPLKRSEATVWRTELLRCTIFEPSACDTKQFATSSSIRGASTAGTRDSKSDCTRSAFMRESTRGSSNRTVVADCRRPALTSSNSSLYSKVRSELVPSDVPARLRVSRSPLLDTTQMAAVLQNIPSHGPFVRLSTSNHTLNPLLFREALNRSACCLSHRVE
mmetsp:Transcript_1548/g.2156  ORF Transcript_1548/g.2156 Transcript_1548/m.2156 type:complete len:205 (+) Transcript_1548:551-1165(+)